MLFRPTARSRAASTAILVSRVGGRVALAIALTVFAAWMAKAAGVETLPRWIYRMNPMTAVCMVLAGAALCIPRSAPPSTSSRVRLALGLAVAAVGVIKLAQFAMGQPASIDLWLFAREVRSLGRSRMAPNTAIAYTLLGASLVLACFRRRWAAPASQVSAALALAVAAAGLVSYLYGAMDLVQFPGPSAMAPQTAMGLTAASVGALWLHPRRAITALLTDKTFGGGT